MGVGFITFGMAVLVLAVGGLLVYMSQLVKNAYQIKIELRTELSEGLQRVDDEADKKLKWIKRDIFEEVDKIKTALTVDHSRRLTELQEAVNSQLKERDEVWRRDRVELIKIIERQREDIKVLDQRVRTLRRDQRRPELVPPLDGTPAPSSEPPPEEGGVDAATPEERVQAR